MTDRQYAEHRIRDALDKTNGNVTRARQQVIAWTYEDAKLLQALAKPHLSGIVAYNIERIIAGRGTAAAEDAPPQDEPVKAAPAAQPQKENFGLELLKAAADSSSTFGLESYGSPGSKKPKVSQAHIDAIQAMTKGKKS